MWIQKKDDLKSENSEIVERKKDEAILESLKNQELEDLRIAQAEMQKAEIQKIEEKKRQELLEQESKWKEENLALRNEYERLLRENSALQNENGKLKNESSRESDKFSSENQKLAQENARLKKQMSEMQNEIGAESEKLLNDNESLKRQIASLKNENGKLKTESSRESSKVSSENQKLLQENERLKKQMESLKNQKSAASSTKNENRAEPKKQVASLTHPKQDAAQNQLAKSRFDIPPAKNGATIVFVIDDAGRSAANTKKYTDLPFPITIAVLPKLPQTRQCADVIRKSGKEMILHQPMQSQKLSLDPGPGAIRGEMSSAEIIQILNENLEELGSGVKGLNNHEGSLITADELRIGTVLDVCREKGIYFLDSRTTAETKAPSAAAARGMRIYEKAGPYIDNEISREKMLERIYETLNYANRRGSAIVIGHVDKSVNILPDLLNEMYPYLKAAGYKFATPSTLR
ncbi:divergent polysaccharide deacetylase family protein [Treponema zioleckii]|uniref:divergent polysaccharide deacetylase family protein n=1 Tax=Treponema zioleckii TaxID=331680 RepID=UPI00168AD7DC|nr:divergent polysaccharide deacetylase family protein [Treponema zioleckii]